MEGLDTLLEEAKELALCVQNAKNLVVDGKDVYADRKLQSALVRCNRILQIIIEMQGGDGRELVDQSESASEPEPECSPRPA